MDASALIARCKELHAVLIPDGDSLRVRAPEPLPSDLLEELREHKPELMAVLAPRPHEWHAQEIARAVEQEGVCIFWAEEFKEMIAFVFDDTFEELVPAGIVAYTNEELLELFGDGKAAPSPESLRLIHEAKKYGGHITGYERSG